MAQLPIDFLLRGDGTRFLPIASLDSVMDGNKTLREILQEYYSEKMNKIYKTSSIVLYRDSLASGIKGPVTGYLKIGLPNNLNIDESINLNISVINKKEEALINIGTEVLSTSFIGSSSFCSNTTPIDGTIRLGGYQGKKCIILGQTSTVWENALIIINFSASNKIDDNWFSNYTMEVLSDESILTNLTTVPINNAFKIDNTDKVNGYRVDDSKGGTNEKDDNALWTAFRIKNEINKNSGLIFGNAVFSANEEGKWKFNVEIPEVKEYKENGFYAFNFSSDTGGNTVININNLGEKTLYKIENGQESLLKNKDILANVVYIFIYQDNKFITVMEDSSSFLRTSSNKNITTVLSDDVFINGYTGTMQTKEGSAFYPKTKTTSVINEKDNKSLDEVISYINNQIKNISDKTEYSGVKNNIVIFGENNLLLDSGKKLEEYVLKEAGKGLSSNDYTEEDKKLVSSINNKVDEETFNETIQTLQNNITNIKTYDDGVLYLIGPSSWSWLIEGVKITATFTFSRNIKAKEMIEVQGKSEKFQDQLKSIGFSGGYTKASVNSKKVQVILYADSLPQEEMEILLIAREVKIDSGNLDNTVWHFYGGAPAKRNFIISDTEPEDTSVFWVESKTRLMKYYDGSNWNAITGVYGKMPDA